MKLPPNPVRTARFKGPQPIQCILIMCSRVFGTVLCLGGITEALDAARFFETRTQEQDGSKPPERNPEQSLTDFWLATADLEASECS